MEPKYGTFHDALTGETIVRELTEQELADLPEASVLDIPVDEPVEGEEP
jgi:hypothetical protein